MTEAAIEEAQRLLRIAKADFAACRALLNAPEVRFANAAFHGQQAIEKSLKAVLTQRCAEMGRTHNLLALTGQLLELGLAAPVSDEQLALLNPYAVVFRYDDIEVELLTGQALIAMVELILDWVADELNSSSV